MINVEEGPNRLYRETPSEGKIKFNVIEGIKVKNIPTKQYFIRIRSIPIDFL
jgi:hypothetical protein